MQPWPGEVLEERSGEIAVGFAALLTRQAAWRHRRVETIEVLSHEEVRRSVSVDFTVPIEHRDELRLSDSEWVVPLAVLDDVAKRRLVKFAYDEPLGRPDRRSHFYGTQGCTEAASYHVELAVPEGMRARSADIVDNRTGEQLLEGPHDSDRPGLHYVAGAGAEIEPGLQVNYATERGGFLVPAMLVAWVLAFELGLAWLFADLRGIAVSGGPAVAVLLSVSAVFSSLVLRAGEHPLVQLVLARYRMLLGAATLAAVAAGGTLAFRGSEVLLNWTWGLGASVALVAAGILSIEVARAPATAKRP